MFSLPRWVVCRMGPATAQPIMNVRAGRGARPWPAGTTGRGLPCGYRGDVSRHRDREIEAALVVAAPHPAGVFARLHRLPTLGGHRLEPLATQRLRDRYLDTPARDLWRRRLAVRERQVDGERLLALKGEIGPRERLEIEEREGDAARERIEAELRARGVRVALATLGVIQERDTTRQRRALTSGGRTTAELALDEVTYRLAAGQVRLHEVEVELADLDADLDPLVAALEQAAPELRAWPYNKLATGAAIATALERGELSLGPAGALPPDAFDGLARRLSPGGR